jgi:hypothetical protein
MSTRALLSPASISMTTMSDHDERSPDLQEEARLPDGRVLTGHVAEWGLLLEALDQRHGLLVVVADPRSGTSAMLGPAMLEAGGGFVVDARRCSHALDLAQAIADAAVAAHQPDAMAWWTSIEIPASPAAIRLARMLDAAGLPYQRLRDPGRDAPALLSSAIDLVAVVAEADEALPRVALDHLGVLLATVRAADAREILSALRTARQRHPKLDLLLVDHPDGPVVSAVADERHPLWRAGQSLRITRPTPERFTTDLAITKPWVKEPVQLLGAAAELANGVPLLIWRIVDLATAAEEQVVRAYGGWRRLQELTLPVVAQQWEMLRRVHPAAQELVAAISLGLAPHSARPAGKSIDDALGRLRDLGLAWQPEPRRWAVADPLLAAYARTHPPAWAARRSAMARRALDPT